MERRLYDAARGGSVSELLKLLDEDPILLDRLPTLGKFAETPLHIAAILGNLEFAKELLKRKPNFASELDLHKSTPLHLACATNNVELVAHLLDVNPGSCLAKDMYGRVPVHVAAIRGRINLLKKMLQFDPIAARQFTDQGDSILHLCIKYNQFESMKVLLEEISDSEFANFVDLDGNTVLHLSVLDKQSEVVSYLLQNTSIDVNAKNGKNQTAMDILYMDGGIIGQTLQNAGAITANYSTNNLQSNQIHVNNKKNNESPVMKFLEQKQEAVMIAASLIAAAAFQVGVTPPGGIYQDNIQNNTLIFKDHKAGTSIMAYSNSNLYAAFIVQNTVGFLGALFVFLLLLTGLPQKYKFFRGVFMVAIWMAIVAIAASYFSSIITVAPPKEQQKVIKFSYTVLIVSIILWILTIMWYSGFGPLLKEKFKKYSKNQPKHSLLGGPASRANTV